MRGVDHSTQQLCEVRRNRPPDCRRSQSGAPEGPSDVEIRHMTRPLRLTACTTMLVSRAIASATHGAVVM